VRRDEELTPEEMEAQDVSTLPDREAMSTIDPTGSSSLLDIQANIDAALDIAAPVDAAVAANANVAAPIDAAVSANALSPDATSLASAPQTSLISQDLDGVANATADQTSDIDQGESVAPDSTTTEAP
jgi:hypothetical protein